MVGGVLVDFHLGAVAGFTADNNDGMSTRRMGEIGIARFQDLTGMGVIGIHGFLGLLLVAVAAVVWGYQGSDGGAVMLVSINIASICFVTIEAADLVLPMR